MRARYDERSASTSISTKQSVRTKDSGFEYLTIRPSHARPHFHLVAGHDRLGGLLRHYKGPGLTMGHYGIRCAV